MRVTAATEAERAWAERVAANRAQVEAVRAGPPRDDFYAPVSARFVDDPHRGGDATLAALLALARPGDRWLDIGAGAGRYALPLALAVREVIAVEPSPSMAAALRAARGEHRIRNVRVVERRWPMIGRARAPRADVALIAHVGYDVAEIGPFMDAMEAAAGRLCVAVLMERSPAGLGDSFWPEVHGVERVALPALPEFLALLSARGRRPALRMLEARPRAWDESDLLRYLRQQLWVSEGGEGDARLLAALRARARPGPEGVWLDGARADVGIVTWEPASRT